MRSRYHISHHYLLETKLSNDVLKSKKIHEAYSEPLKKLAIGFKNFCIDFATTNPAPHPEDEELFELYIDKLSKEEKLHSA